MNNMYAASALSLPPSFFLLSDDRTRCYILRNMGCYTRVLLACTWSPFSTITTTTTSGTNIQWYYCYYYKQGPPRYLGERTLYLHCFTLMLYATLWRHDYRHHSQREFRTALQKMTLGFLRKMQQEHSWLFTNDAGYLWNSRFVNTLCRHIDDYDWYMNVSPYSCNCYTVLLSLI
jgi:hypothetical protein